MTDDRRRFFFAHVQKAAGTSLYRQLQRHFEREQIYPDPSEYGVGPTRNLLLSQLCDSYRIRRDQIRIVTGHFPVRSRELLGDQFTTLTVVRDPVERTLSFSVTTGAAPPLMPSDRSRSSTRTRSASTD